MWHEARKQEKKLRTMVVDYKRRAERRREFYEKFKADPTQFMQVHGRPCKIHLDPQVSAAADSCMVPWQGNKDSMIDRFDVRAHLDIIPEYKPGSEPREVTDDDSQLNYERYRILVQNDLSKISEDKFLHQIHLEEQFGTAVGPGKHKHHQEIKSSIPKAAIGYTYDDSNPTGNAWSVTGSKGAAGAAGPIDKKKDFNKPKSDSEEDSDEELDFDLLVNMDDMTFAQKAELNVNGTKYGLAGGEFMEFLNADLEEKEQMRLAKLQEEEKQAMSGRKARRERRAYKDRLILRKGYISPPSYAAQGSPGANEEDAEEKVSSSGSISSRSSSKEKIEFITSFGGNEAEKEKPSFAVTPFGPTLPSSVGLPKQTRKWARSRSRSPMRRKMRSRSRSRSKSRDRRYGVRTGRGRNDRTDRGRRKRSKSSSRSSSRSKHRRRRSTSSSSSRSSSRTRNRRNNRKLSRGRRSRSRNRNGKSRSRSRSKNRSRRGKRRSISRDRRIRRRRSSSKSSSSSSRRSNKRKSFSSRRSSSESSPRKSRSKEPSVSSIPLPSSSSHLKPVQTSLRPNSSSNNNISSEALKVDTPAVNKLPSPPVKRYYGRAKEKSPSDSESSESSASSSKSSDDSRNKSEKSSGGKGKTSVNSSTKMSGNSCSSGVKLTPREKMKRKMQAALTRHLKADKEAEKARQEKLDQERMEREETLRELTIKYRRREREKRHKEMVDHHSRSPSYSSENSSRSPSPVSSKGRRSGQNSRSNSPVYF